MVDELVVSDNTLLELTLKDPVGELIDLSGSQVKLRVVLNGAAVSEKTMMLEDQITRKGIVTYALLDVDLVEGIFEGEVLITTGMGKEYTSERFYYPVRKRLGA